MTVPFKQIPWMYPVPVRRESKYRSYKPIHETFAVSTDLAAMEMGRLAEGELLFADFQNTVDMQVIGRLGSGRAGVYKGHYLKGIGRTPLAQNWNTADLYHNSGHMYASAALREYVVSYYLGHKGLARTIVPCSGFLLAPLEDPRIVSQSREMSPFAVDSALKAISVKKWDFARMSNFSWLVKQMPSTYNFAKFKYLLRYFLEETDEEIILEDLEAEPLIARFASKIEKGISNLVASFEGGVTCWLSYHNNFTIDGRFLDIELPLILGAPFLGHRDSPDNKTIVKHDFFLQHALRVYLYQVRIFLYSLTIQLDLLTHHELLVDKKERAALAAFAQAIRTQPLLQEIASDDYGLNIAHQQLSRIFELDSNDEKELLRLLKSEEVDPTSCAETDNFALISEMRRFRLIECDLASKQQFCHDEARILNSLFTEITALQSSDEIFSCLQGIEAAIRKFSRKSATRAPLENIS